MTPASDIRLIALDVDGTLAARGNEVTPRTRESLHRAVAAGIHVAIATGRRYRTTLRIVEALDLPVDVVCLGGALVKDRDGRTLEAVAFEATDFTSIHGLAREHGHAIVCHRDSAEQGGADFVVDSDVEWNGPTRSYTEQNQGYFAHGSGLGHEACPDALVIGAFATETELRGWHAAIEEKHPGHFLPSLIPGGINDGWYFELTPRNVSKWSGLQALARRLGIAPAAICAVGDQVNDLPMLEQAGMSVAMGNAVDAVKETADWVTGANDEDGIVAVVERILGR